MEAAAVLGEMESSQVTFRPVSQTCRAEMMMNAELSLSAASGMRIFSSFLCLTAQKIESHSVLDVRWSFSQFSKVLQIKLFIDS